MSLYKADCIIVKEEEGTEGGTTYYVMLKDDPDQKVKKLCFRQSKDPEHPGERCANHAGYNTNHAGTGACFLHGGNNFQTIANVSAHITNGRMAKATRSRLTEKINQYLNEDSNKTYDLTEELASMRAILEEFIDHMAPPLDEEGKSNVKYGNDVLRASMIVGTIGNLVEKISKIESRNTLTIAQVLYIRAIITDIFIKYIRDPDARERAIRELATRMGDDGKNVPHLVHMDKYEVLDINKDSTEDEDDSHRKRRTRDG